MEALMYYTEKIEIHNLSYWRVYAPNGDTAGTVVQRDYGFVGTPDGEQGESFNTFDSAVSHVATCHKYPR